jgi:hypothetical protein
MTVKELIEELQEIDKKYQDCELVIYHLASGDGYRITSVDDVPNWDDSEEIYINV